MQSSDAPDIAELIEELDQRVDRLRAVYDQYFMGFERLEPTVQRKDVERRLAFLLKQQIRNTAQRFKLNMIRQRLTTYQTHWMRVCRQIEEGTFKRHLQRAQARFGPDAARQRLRDERAGAKAAAEDGALEASRGSEAPKGAPRTSLRPPALDDSSVDDPFAGLGTEPGSAPELPGVAAAPPSASLRPRPAAPAIRRREPSLPGEMASPLPPSDRLPPPPSSERVLPPPSSSRLPPPPERAPLAAPVASPRVAAPQIRRRDAEPPRGAPAPSDPPIVPRRPTPPPSHAAALSVPFGAPPKRAPSPPSPSDDLSERRVRELYREYVLARLRKNEPTSTVTFDAVAKQLRESRAKLAAKHGKAVDFEVSEKDGKTVLKPVIR